MSYMPYTSAYNGPSQEFLNWNQVSGYPFHNFFRNDPLSTTTWIDPRRGGFRPYGQGIRVSEEENINNECSVFQTSCDIILPVNKCYREHPTIVTQP